jgi:hypothetical protein
MRLGDISDKTVEAVGESMARARKANVARDASGCKAALADAQKALPN